MLTITQGKGFRLKFANGWAVSVQWGVMNYCQRQDYGASFGCEKCDNWWHSKTAECAVFNPEGTMMNMSSYDTVRGHMTADEVAELIHDVATGAFVPVPREEDDYPQE